MLTKLMPRKYSTIIVFGMFLKQKYRKITLMKKYVIALTHFSVLINLLLILSLFYTFI